MAPGDELDVAPMLKFALAHNGPASLRYPKARLEKSIAPWPRSSWARRRSTTGARTALIAYGTLFPTCVKAAQKLREGGLNIGVINARFAKPLDKATLFKAVEELPLVVTVEEGTLEGGFGAALLEAANGARLDTRHIVRLGLPDRFIEHGERAELLADLGLDVPGVSATVWKAWGGRRRR